jgi:hypothetical protein
LKDDGLIIVHVVHEEDAVPERRESFLHFASIERSSLLRGGSLQTIQDAVFITLGLKPP